MTRFNKKIAAVTAALMLSSALPLFSAVQTPITLNKVSPEQRSDFATKLQKYLNDNDFDGALALFDSLSNDMANDFDILFLKASILFSAKRLDESEALCTRLLSVGRS